MFYDSGGASNKHNYCNPRMRGMEWGLVVLVFVLLWGLGPYTLYYANIMLCVFVPKSNTLTDRQGASLPPQSAALEMC